MLEKSNMLNEKLMSLVESVIVDGHLDTAYLQAGDMIESGENLPSGIEAQLINFISDKNEITFTVLAKEILFKNLLNDYEENIKLISFLTGKGWLSLKDAALLLSAVPHTERNKLPVNFTKAVEVADLVCEDSSDGFMDAADDDLLVNALKAVS